MEIKNKAVQHYSVRTDKIEIRDMVSYYADKTLRGTLNNRITPDDVATGLHLEPTLMADVLSKKVLKLTENKKKKLFANLDVFINGKKPNRAVALAKKIDKAFKNKPSGFLTKITKNNAAERADALRASYAHILQNALEMTEFIEQENKPKFSYHMRRLRVIAKQNGFDLKSLLRR